MHLEIHQIASFSTIHSDYQAFSVYSQQEIHKVYNGRVCTIGNYNILLSDIITFCHRTFARPNNMSDNNEVWSDRLSDEKPKGLRYIIIMFGRI